MCETRRLCHHKYDSARLRVCVCLCVRSSVHTHAPTQDAAAASARVRPKQRVRHSLAPPHARVRVWAARRPAAAAAAVLMPSLPQSMRRRQRMACRSDVRAPAAPSYRGCADTPLPASSKAHTHTGRVRECAASAKDRRFLAVACVRRERSSDGTHAHAPPKRARPAHSAGSNGAPPSSGRRKPRVRAWRGMAWAWRCVSGERKRECVASARKGASGKRRFRASRVLPRAPARMRRAAPSSPLPSAVGRAAGARAARGGASGGGAQPRKPRHAAGSKRTRQSGGCACECVPAPPTA
jgi:hypothetical protein